MHIGIRIKYLTYCRKERIKLKHVCVVILPIVYIFIINTIIAKNAVRRYLLFLRDIRQKSSVVEGQNSRNFYYLETCSRYY